MNRKICLRVFLTLLLALSVFAALNVSAAAASITAEIGSQTLDTNTVEPTGDYYSVAVPVVIKSNSGFLTASMDVSYPAEFVLTGWTEGDIFPAADDAISSEANKTSNDPANLQHNPFTVMYFTYDTNITATGNLITLNFNVPKDIEAGNYTVSAEVTDAVAQGDDPYALPDTITDDFTVSAGTVSVVRNPGGKCGDDLYWEYNPTKKILSITGTGAMDDFATAPWDAYKANIEALNIAEGVTSITDGAFADCTSLATVTVAAGNANYSVVDNVLFENTNTLALYPAGKAGTEYTVPATVTAIAAKAFYNTGLTTITIHENVTSIGANAITSGTIKGIGGSEAEDYAEANGLNFIDIATYIIKFVGKDDEEILTKEYTANEVVELPAAPNYGAHFTFLGWSNGVDDDLIKENFNATKALTLKAVYEEDEKFTVVITATDGGLLVHKGETQKSFELEEYVGTVLTFEAIDDPSDSETNILRNWYDITNGQVISLTGAADGAADTVLEYTVTKNVIIDANFVPATHHFPVRLIAFVNSTVTGYFTVGADDVTEFSFFSDYAPANTTTKLTARAYNPENYTPAYWVRLDQDVEVEVLIATGAVANVYPLGGSVFYQPVFKATSADAIELYIDAATYEILDAAPDANEYNIELSDLSIDGVVNVNICTKKEEVASDYKLTVIGLDEEGNEAPIYSETAPTFASSWIISTDNEDTKWTMSINGEAAFDVSYDREFRFNYMFSNDTEIVIKEVKLGNDEAADVIIDTVVSWSEGDIARFTGIFDLPAGYTLVNHGIMMDQNKRNLTKLQDNTTGEINVSATTIVGRVTDNSENATPLFTVAKRLANADDVWYGRAFIVYTDDTTTDAPKTTYVKYASEVLTSLTDATIVEGTTPGNEDIYGPAYWDETVIFVD